MKLILAVLLAFSIGLAASTDKKEADIKKQREQKQLEEQMKKEQKYSKEQVFYQGDNYDFKSAEVNKDSLDSVPDIPVDDFNIDNVYD